MPVANNERLLEVLEELEQYIRRLAERKFKLDLAEKLLDEIDELKQILQDDEVDELEAFKLLRMFVDKMRTFAPNVPLLKTFLRLYVEALKSTETFLEEYERQFGFLGESYRQYRRARENVERTLEESDEELDDEEFDERAHEMALDAIGHPFNKYGDDLWECWDTRRRKEEVEEERRRAEADAEELGNGPEPEEPREPEKPEKPEEPRDVETPGPVAGSGETPQTPEPTCCDRYGDERPRVDTSGLQVGLRHIDGRVSTSHPCGIATLTQETYAFDGRSDESRLTAQSRTSGEQGSTSASLWIDTPRRRGIRHVFVIVQAVSECGTTERIAVSTYGTVRTGFR